MGLISGIKSFFTLNSKNKSYHVEIPKKVVKRLDEYRLVTQHETLRDFVNEAVAVYCWCVDGALKQGVVFLEDEDGSVRELETFGLTNASGRTPQNESEQKLENKTKREKQYVDYKGVTYLKPEYVPKEKK